MNETVDLRLVADDRWTAADDLPSPDYEVLPDFTEVVATARDAGIELWLRPLPFFTGSVWMLRILPRGVAEAGAAYGLWSGHGLHPLDGTSTPIHDAIEREGLELSDTTVLEYTIWFCRHVHGDEGPFWAVLRRDDLNVADPAARAAVVAAHIPAPSVETKTDGDGWSVGFAVQYGETLFAAQFSVDRHGRIEMDDDEPLAAGLGADTTRNRSPPAWTFTDSMIRIEGHPPAARRRPARQAVRRSAGEALVRLQLIAALRRGDAAALFESAHDDDEALLTRFATFLLDSAALVIVVSRTDYVERIVGDLVTARLDRKVSIKRSAFVPHPEPTSKLPDIEDGDLVEISLHEGSRVDRAQAVAFILGSTDAAALVGCRSPNDLPEPLRQIADLTISLGEVDHALFRALFCDVFDCAWPDGLDLGAAEWLAYLEPADLQRASRDQAFRSAAAAAGTAPPWRAEDAVAAVRDRVRERLARYLPRERRRLAELVGLGEARQAVEDLVADIRAVLDRRLAWGDVDRGMLLVGPPGTGKTMLARVMAQECGVRFVNARIGEWMTGDSNLGAVILAMRQTFADARHFAPCILFLDEIDSLGNRRDFGGRNESWDVAFLTAVLEQMQGFEATQGVFVIGATNHEEHVDLALRRAGRLDRVVHLEYPLVADLGQILEQYLAPYRATGRLDAEVDTAALGAVMAGSSGAEVAQFVRDAVRRARRDRAPVGTRHLLAAATGSPRRPIASRASTPAELERTAFHEAGHAVAQLLGRHHVMQLTVVSIVQRTNGTLGFTGFVPGHTVGWTSAHYRDYLRTLLAGRAAEELRYGAPLVSSGAGGSSESCDLAVATTIATRMFCQARLHAQGMAAWRQRPSVAEDLSQVRAVLDECYADCLQMLRTHWPAMEALAGRLVDERQLLGPEVVDMVRRHGLRLPAARDAFSREAAS